MLADREEGQSQSGNLDRDIHLPAAWRLSLIEFIAGELPKWRDDPKRPDDTAETLLTSRLCAHMNSATRKSGGWDFLQFRVEEPDEVTSGRTVDLVPAPSAATIWIDGREYTQYAPLIPIECKRLPIPSGSTRDEREYLYSAYSTTGGVQRFKAGHHGAAHSTGAMIGYIQNRDIDFWDGQIREWLEGLVDAAVAGWTRDDILKITSRNAAARSALLESTHRREGGLPDIRLHHLWIDMIDPETSENRSMGSERSAPKARVSKSQPPRRRGMAASTEPASTLREGRARARDLLRVTVLLVAPSKTQQIIIVGGHDILPLSREFRLSPPYNAQLVC